MGMLDMTIEMDLVEVTGDTLRYESAADPEGLSVTFTIKHPYLMSIYSKQQTTRMRFTNAPVSEKGGPHGESNA